MPTINPTNNPAHPSNFPVDSARPTTHNEMVDMWNAFRTDGFDDAEVNKLIRGAINTGDVSPYGNAIMHAVVTPTMPEKYLDQSKFLEVLAWYIDKSSPGGGNGDGKLQLPEVEAAIDKYRQQYLSQSTDPAQANSRMQSWKFIQKLRIIEKSIENRAAAGGEAFYPYDARAMMTINSTEFNANHTVDSRAEFNETVIKASYEKPVLVKYGLTYCAHCMLLEQLGSVPAVADKYGDAMDVKKLWWNPHDTAYNELNEIAGENKVTSSPMFILYKDGEIVKSGYGFPDETGAGLEDFLKGHIEEPAVA
ncbi:MAG: thioredoxin family protein [Deltaproteobacteria bacterium]|nr:thioredoxin family protein [Deltaproteobacteria bacterium]